MHPAACASLDRTSQLAFDVILVKQALLEQLPKGDLSEIEGCLGGARGPFVVRRGRHEVPRT